VVFNSKFADILIAIFSTLNKDAINKSRFVVSYRDFYQ
jgi:hypothetical protein